MPDGEADEVVGEISWDRDDDLVPLIGLEISWPREVRPEVAALTGVYQVDIVCRHSSSDPDTTVTRVAILNAKRRTDGAGWEVLLTNGSHVVADDDHEVGDGAGAVRAAWHLAAPNTDSDFRRRFRFTCPTCGTYVPARAEHLDAVVAKLSEHNVTSIELAELRKRL